MNGLTHPPIVLLLLLLALDRASVAEDINPSLDIESLMNQKITSVSKTPQNLPDAAAAVFVISRDDIRRSGATSLPEALRLAPGIHVARIDANQWAISARGFNGRFANKLLVLVDGRSVYTPIFSGVYWKALDLPLDDIERIEVIRGPGASLWGANAVNGIINIISRHADDTQGGLLNLIVGDEERTILDLRYGFSNRTGHADGRQTDALAFRTYGRFAARDGFVGSTGDETDAEWTLARAGFRLDGSVAANNAFTLQGDWFDADIERRFVIDTENVLDEGTLSGYSLQARWEQTQSLASRTALQVYYQREQRDDLFADYHLGTLDVDFQHEFAVSEQHELIWGLAYRHHRDDFEPAPLLDMAPGQRDYQLFSAFIQDRLSLFDGQLDLTLGSKLEHNSFTGWEVQPSLKALWKPDSRQRLWASLSRAVRTPSRGDDDAIVSLFDIPAGSVVFLGDRDFESETVVAYELGYRIAPRADLSIDLAAFYNDYDDLRLAFFDETRATVGPQGLQLPIVVANAEQGHTYGVELAADWRPTDRWRVQLAYSYLRAAFDLKSEFDDALTFPADFGDDRNPRHQGSLRSSFELAHGIELDVWLRYVDHIDDIQVATLEGIASVDGYLTLDLRLGWRPSENLEFALGGRNLLDSPHLEYLNETNTVISQVERSFYGQLKWRF